MKFATSRAHVIAVMAAVEVLFASGSVLAEDNALPPDGTSPKVVKFNDVRDSRYCEIILIAGDPAGDRKGAVYQTLGLNACPPATWSAIDAEAIKKQFQVLGVMKNGPRSFIMDQVEVKLGAERAFEGLNTRWEAIVVLPKGMSLEHMAPPPYHPIKVHRETKYVFKKGKPVFELVDPTKRSYVMQSYSMIVDPSMNYQSLMALGSKMKGLPTGWSYRVRTLKEDMVTTPVDGVAHVVEDEFSNMYQREN